MSPQEERLVLELHNKWGNRWSRIARKLPGRTDNEIKNYWRTHMRKKAQEKKRAMLPPLSSSSNSSSSSVTNNPTVDSLPFPTGQSFYDTGGVVSNMSGSGKDKICTDHEVSMDDIWKDIDLSEETTVFYDGCINFTCPPLMAAAASPTCWGEYCPEALWMMDDEGVNNTFG